MRIGELLIGQGHLTPEGLDEALEWQVLYGGRLGTNLLELQLASEEHLARGLGKQLGCEVAWGNLDVDPALVGLVPKHIAERDEMVPWKMDRRRVKVLVTRIDPGKLDQLSYKIGKSCMPVVAPEFRVVNLLRAHYGAMRQMRALDFGMVPEEGRRRRKQKGEPVPAAPAPELIDEKAFNEMYNQVLAGKSSPSLPVMAAGQGSAEGPAGDPAPAPAAVPAAEAVPPHAALEAAEGKGPAGASAPVEPAKAADPVVPLAKSAERPPLEPWPEEEPTAEARTRAETKAQEPAKPQAEAKPLEEGRPQADTAPIAERKEELAEPVPEPEEETEKVRGPAVETPREVSVIEALPEDAILGEAQSLPVVPPPAVASPVVPRPLVAPTAAPPPIGRPAAASPPTVPPAAVPAAPPVSAQWEEPPNPARQVDDSPLAFEEALQLLRGVENRDSVARIVLRASRSKAARALLLLVQGNVVLGWDGLGEGVDKGAARSVAVSLAAPSVFQLVVKTRSHFLGPLQRTPINIRFLAQIGKKVPLSSMVLPILHHERVSHVLYLDNGHKKQAPTDVGEMLILSQRIGQTVDALVDRRKVARG